MALRADDVDLGRDRDLVARYQNGDPEAFDDLYRCYFNRLRRYCQRHTSDRHEAEEVAQEVLTEVWRSAKRFDPDKGSAMTWIMTIAHRRSVDCVRSVQASRDRDERVGHRDRERAFDVVSEAVETREDHERVRAALEQLTDLQREVVDLAYFGGHTYREVAELLDTPLGTVKTRMRDGLIRLRDAMGVER